MVPCPAGALRRAARGSRPVPPPCAAPLCRAAACARSLRLGLNPEQKPRCLVLESAGVRWKSCGHSGSSLFPPNYFLFPFSCFLLFFLSPSCKLSPSSFFPRIFSFPSFRSPVVGIALSSRCTFAVICAFAPSPAHQSALHRQ